MYLLDAFYWNLTEEYLGPNKFVFFYNYFRLAIKNDWYKVHIVQLHLYCEMQVVRNIGKVYQTKFTLYFFKISTVTFF